MPPVRPIPVGPTPDASPPLPPWAVLMILTEALPTPTPLADETAAPPETPVIEPLPPANAEPLPPVAVLLTVTGPPLLLPFTLEEALPPTAPLNRPPEPTLPSTRLA